MKCKPGPTKQYRSEKKKKKKKKTFFVMSVFVECYSWSVLLILIRSVLPGVLLHVA